MSQATLKWTTKNTDLETTSTRGQLPDTPHHVADTLGQDTRIHPCLQHATLLRGGQTLTKLGLVQPLPRGQKGLEKGAESLEPTSVGRSTTSTHCEGHPYLPRLFLFVLKIIQLSPKEYTTLTFCKLLPLWGTAFLEDVTSQTKKLESVTKILIQIH